MSDKEVAYKKKREAVYALTFKINALIETLDDFEGMDIPEIFMNAISMAAANVINAIAEQEVNKLNNPKAQEEMTDMFIKTFRSHVDNFSLNRK